MRGEPGVGLVGLNSTGMAVDEKGLQVDPLFLIMFLAKAAGMLSE